jgi:hypothetical protein
MGPSPVPQCMSTSEWPDNPNANGPYGWSIVPVGNRSRTKNSPAGVGVDAEPTPTTLVRITAPSASRISFS